MAALCERGGCSRRGGSQGGGGGQAACGATTRVVVEFRATRPAAAGRGGRPLRGHGATGIQIGGDRRLQLRGISIRPRTDAPVGSTPRRGILSQTTAVAFDGV